MVNDAVVLNQKVNAEYADVFQKKPRYIILMGGRGAGRSTVGSQFALAKLVEENYFRCAIMRFILTDVRNSIYQEIKDRAEEQGVLDALSVTDNKMILTYGKNRINAVGFRKTSSDQKSKLKSLANYNCVIIEEADEIPEADFMQLDDSLRTTKGDITIILLLNPPPKSHWIVQRWFDMENVEGVKGFYKPKLRKEFDDVVFINTNYKDNIKNISEQTARNYERYKETKPDYYYNMICGYVPEVVRGKIYKNWKVIDELPHEARLECYALDFGFHPDPAAIVAIYYLNGAFIFDEVCYQTELQNRHLATIIKNQPEKAIVIADQAEPKSIAELKELGLDIIPCDKGKDSVNFGIKRVQSVKVMVTARSKNILKEYENYAWKVDKKSGAEESFPDPNCDDHTMDAIRYAISLLQPTDPLEERMNEVEKHSRNKEREAEARANAGLA